MGQGPGANVALAKLEQVVQGDEKVHCDDRAAEGFGEDP